MSDFVTDLAQLATRLEEVAQDFRRRRINRGLAVGMFDHRNQAQREQDFEDLQAWAVAAAQKAAAILRDVPARTIATCKTCDAPTESPGRVRSDAFCKTCDAAFCGEHYDAAAGLCTSCAAGA